jgi:pterin-4a-carbinolamine dehydratase
MTSLLPGLGDPDIKSIVEIGFSFDKLRGTDNEIKGLHQNDFIMAARTDRLYSPPDKTPA